MAALGMLSTLAIKADELQAIACYKVIAKSIADQRVKCNGRWVSLPTKPLAVDDWVLAKPQPDYEWLQTCILKRMYSVL
jgi:hypothetical protein